LVCLRAPAGRRRLYLVGALFSGLAVFVLTPFVSSIGWHVIWSGPTGPCLGQLDVTREELRIGLFQVLRLTAVALAFAAYALLLDHDRLVQSVGSARGSGPPVGRAPGRAARAARGGRWRAGAVSCGRSSGTRPGWSRRCAGAGWRSRAPAAGRGCWRLSW